MATGAAVATASLFGGLSYTSLNKTDDLTFRQQNLAIELADKTQAAYVQQFSESRSAFLAILGQELLAHSQGVEATSAFDLKVEKDGSLSASQLMPRTMEALGAISGVEVSKASASLSSPSRHYNETFARLYGALRTGNVDEITKKDVLENPAYAPKKEQLNSIVSRASQIFPLAITLLSGLFAYDLTMKFPILTKRRRKPMATMEVQ